MKVVRHRMIKPSLSLLFAISLMAISSCNPTELSPRNSRSNIIANDGTYDNMAFVYRDSPYILGGSQIGPTSANMNRYVDKTKMEFISASENLTSNCVMSFLGMNRDQVDNCVRTLVNTESVQLLPKKADKTWNFEVGTPEFYQVNTQYHVNLATDTFFRKLSYAYDKVHGSFSSAPKSIPYYLKDSDFFWFKGVANSDSKQFRNDYLTVYAQCNNEKNANFSPAGVSLCFGYSSTHPGFYMVQDPSVIYHELGHGLVSIMMNLRNGTATSAHALRSNLGGLGYDEGGSINEGIADYYSYVMNKRTHFGEWGLGKIQHQSRPLREDDPMHIPGIDVTSEGRLSYPQYLLYDPNNSDSHFEDVHYAGQIVSHYMVALTDSLKNKCSLSGEEDGGHETATSYVMLLLAETLSEIGDLNAKGVDESGAPFASAIYFNNLDPVNSYLWSSVVNPPNMRRFFQVFSKNVNKYVSNSLCPSFAKDDSEKMLDDYGLLLFKTYNNNGNSSKNRSIAYNTVAPSIAPQGLTPVNEDNRRKTVMVSKEFISLAESTETTPRVGFYIVDNRADMQGILSNILFKGFTVPLSTNVSSVDYNNSNIKVSPGEVVAVIPNLFNASNSTMAGVQLLANDWDHVHITDTATGNFKPCVIDEKTTVDQGGELANTCATTSTEYNRLVKNTATNLFPAEAAAPICMVQLDSGTSSKWVSQNEYRKKQGLSLQDKDCLGYSASGTTNTDFNFNPHECLVRFLPGANESFFSKIDAQKTYYESVVAQTEKRAFYPGNLLLMEVNKWIPPGTKFRCRMRARFNNCSDCFNDTSNSSDDFLDYEFNGAKPFKVINFDFDVND